MSELLQWAQAITAGGAITVLVWIVKNLTDKEGALAPRWYADQEHAGRIGSDERADRAFDLAEASIALHEKIRAKD